MSIGDVSEASQTSETSQTEEVQTTSETATTLGDGTVGSLPKPLVDAICSAIAYNICSSSSNSNQRLHDILADADQDNK